MESWDNFADGSCGITLADGVTGTTMLMEARGKPF
jgi:hypothetical protein